MVTMEVTKVKMEVTLVTMVKAVKTDTMMIMVTGFHTQELDKDRAQALIMKVMIMGTKVINMVVQEDMVMSMAMKQTMEQAETTMTLVLKLIEEKVREVFIHLTMIMIQAFLQEQDQ